MRAIVTVVGIEKRMTGISKTSGKPYDFQTIHCTYQSKTVSEGCSVVSMAISGNDLDSMSGIFPGDKLDIVWHTDKSNRVWVDAVIA